MQEFKIGDKVVVNGEYDCVEFNDARGIIRSLRYLTNENCVGVEFDFFHENFHDCEGTCIPDRGYHILTSMCTLEEDPLDVLAREYGITHSQEHHYEMELERDGYPATRTIRRDVDGNVGVPYCKSEEIEKIITALLLLRRELQQ